MYLISLSLYIYEYSCLVYFFNRNINTCTDLVNATGTLASAVHQTIGFIRSTSSSFSVPAQGNPSSYQDQNQNQSTPCAGGDNVNHNVNSDKDSMQDNETSKSGWHDRDHRKGRTNASHYQRGSNEYHGNRNRSRTEHNGSRNYNEGQGRHGHGSESHSGLGNRNDHQGHGRGRHHAGDGSGEEHHGGRGRGGHQTSRSKRGRSHYYRN